MLERRAEPRKAARIIFNLETGAGNQSLRAPLRGHTRDLHEHGLALVVNSQASDQQICANSKVRVILLHGVTNIVMEAEVRHVERYGTSGEYLMGLKIEGMTADSKYAYGELLRAAENQ